MCTEISQHTYKSADKGLIPGLQRPNICITM